MERDGLDHLTVAQLLHRTNCNCFNPHLLDVIVCCDVGIPLQYHGVTGGTIGVPRVRVRSVCCGPNGAARCRI